MVVEAAEQPDHPQAGETPRLMGPMRLERAYYYCPACRRGSCPRDRALDLQDTCCHRAPPGWWV